MHGQLISFDSINKCLHHCGKVGKQNLDFSVEQLARSKQGNIVSVSEWRVFDIDCFSVLTRSLHVLMTAGLNGLDLLISLYVCEVLAKIVTHCCKMKCDDDIHCQTICIQKHNSLTLQIGLPYPMFG